MPDPSRSRHEGIGDEFRRLMPGRGIESAWIIRLAVAAGAPRRIRSRSPDRSVRSVPGSGAVARPQDDLLIQYIPHLLCQGSRGKRLLQESRFGMHDAVTDNGIVGVAGDVQNLHAWAPCRDAL